MSTYCLPLVVQMRAQRLRILVIFAALVVVSCGSPAAPSTPVAPSASGATTQPAAPSATTNMRGSRYCEIFLGYVQGTTASIQIYNTVGVNDCPANEWNAINPDQLKTQTAANFVELNGPRVWLMDAFSGSTQLLDPTVRNLGGVEMRLAGVLTLATRDVPSFLSGNSPYEVGIVNRNTVWVYDPGKPLFELIGPQGDIFIMQSFSQQVLPLIYDDLHNLAFKLDLPSGWTYREVVAKETVEVAAVDQLAHVTQDELKNTYQLSQLPRAPRRYPARC